MQKLIHILDISFRRLSFLHLAHSAGSLKSQAVQANGIDARLSSVLSETRSRMPLTEFDLQHNFDDDANTSVFDIGSKISISVLNVRVTFQLDPCFFLNTKTR